MKARVLGTVLLALASVGAENARATAWGSISTMSTKFVTSLNGQTGAVSLVPGANVAITQGAGQITISASLPAIGPVTVRRRKYYLTQNGYDGSHALGACATGFHMASMYEIHDVSNLRYDITRGLTTDDSGYGPPTEFAGWLRTGWASDSSDTLPGFANCAAWTSNSATDYGTFANLTSAWLNPSAQISPWSGAFSVGCDTAAAVWCVEDDAD